MFFDVGNKLFKTQKGQRFPIVVTKKGQRFSTVVTKIGQLFPIVVTKKDNYSQLLSQKKDGSCCPEKFLHSCNPGLAKTSLRFFTLLWIHCHLLLLFFAYLNLSSCSGMWTTTAPSSCRSSSRRSRPRLARSSRTTSTPPWVKWRPSWW